jgi:hypothetical protein
MYYQSRSIFLKIIVNKSRLQLDAAKLRRNLGVITFLDESEYDANWQDQCLVFLQ